MLLRRRKSGVQLGVLVADHHRRIVVRESGLCASQSVLLQALLPLRCPHPRPRARCALDFRIGASAVQDEVAPRAGRDVTGPLSGIATPGPVQVREVGIESTGVRSTAASGVRFFYWRMDVNARPVHVDSIAGALRSRRCQLVSTRDRVSSRPDQVDLFGGRVISRDDRVRSKPCKVVSTRVSVDWKPDRHDSRVRQVISMRCNVVFMRVSVDWKPDRHDSMVRQVISMRCRSTTKRVNVDSKPCITGIDALPDDSQRLQLDSQHDEPDSMG